jgi:hypothetical protein
MAETMCIRNEMAETKALNEKLEGYLKDPTACLDLSGINIGVKGVKVVAAFLPKW